MRKLILLLVIILLTGCVSNEVISQFSSLEDFQGKPTLILFAATYCELCQSAVPSYREEIFLEYGESINFWINVVDNKRFRTDIPQGLNTKLEFEDITHVKCNFVPSWIILDSEGNVVDFSCGSQKGLNEIKNNLDFLIGGENV